MLQKKEINSIVKYIRTMNDAIILDSLDILVKKADGYLKEEYQDMSIHALINEAKRIMPSLIEKAYEPSRKKDSFLIRNKALLTVHKLSPDNTNNSPVNIMFSAMLSGALTETHRHGGSPNSQAKEEHFYVIRGELAIIFRSDTGRMTQIVFLSEKNPYVYIPPTTYHEVITLTESAGMLEFKPGTYDPNTDKEIHPHMQQEEFDAHGNITHITLRYISNLRRSLLSLKEKNPDKAIVVINSFEEI